MEGQAVLRCLSLSLYEGGDTYMGKSLETQKTQAEKKLAQLQNRQKILLNRIREEERRARNHRLIVHGAILESVFPFTAKMESEAIKTFLIALSRPSDAWELAEKMLETRDKG